MKRTVRFMSVVACASLAWLIVGCEPDGTNSGVYSRQSARRSSGPARMAPPFGGPEDVQRARQLWNTALRD